MSGKRAVTRIVVALEISAAKTVLNTLEIVPGVVGMVLLVVLSGKFTVAALLIVAARLGCDWADVEGSPKLSADCSRIAELLSSPASTSV